MQREGGQGAGKLRGTLPQCDETPQQPHSREPRWPGHFTQLCDVTESPTPVGFSLRLG